MILDTVRQVEGLPRETVFIDATGLVYQVKSVVAFDWLERVGSNEIFYPSSISLPVEVIKLP